jgi:hypothetical protein
VADVVVNTLEKLDLHFPKLDPKKQSELAEARRLLESE